MINKTENLQDIMKEAYEKKDEQIAVFIANHFEDYINGKDTDAFYYLYWLAYYLPYEDFQEFVFGENRYFYTWEYVGDEYLTQSPDDTATVKYVWVDDNQTADGLGIVHKYMKFESNCRNIDSLGEKFILTDNVEESDSQ